MLKADEQNTTGQRGGLTGRPVQEDLWEQRWRPAVQDRTSRRDIIYTFSVVSTGKTRHTQF